jgi:hypothetical protein
MGKTVLPFVLALQLSIPRPLVVVAASDAWNLGWNLDEACMPIGEVSKAYFSYTTNTDTEQAVSFALTVDWGELEQVKSATLGGATDSEVDQLEFTHTFERGGMYETFFTAEMGDQKVKLKKVCTIVEPQPNPVVSDVLQADNSSADSTMRASSYAVAFTALALGYISSFL